MGKGELYIYIKGETIHKTIQKHRIPKIENKRTKKKETKVKYLENIEGKQITIMTHTPYCTEHAYS
jgi:hypothetical protein